MQKYYFKIDEQIGKLGSVLAWPSLSRIVVTHIISMSLNAHALSYKPFHFCVDSSSVGSTCERVRTEDEVTSQRCATRPLIRLCVAKAASSCHAVNVETSAMLPRHARKETATQSRWCSDPAVIYFVTCIGYALLANLVCNFFGPPVPERQGTSIRILHGSNLLRIAARLRIFFKAIIFGCLR
jgi:hypothetical protein